MRIAVSHGVADSEGTASIPYPNGHTIYNSYIISVKKCFTNVEYFTYPYVWYTDSPVGIKSTFIQHAYNTVNINVGPTFANNTFDIIFATFD